jgi:DNA ligase D-like protein (predicted ligase)
VNDWRGELSCDEREALEASSHPGWCSPMLATLTHEQFSDSDWLFEPKLDGERLLAFRDGDKTRLMTRNRKSAAETYPELIESLKRQPISDFVVDGEVVAFDNGISSFSRLQQRMKISNCDEACASNVAVHFYLFDLIHVDGQRLDALPLRTRKRLLRHLFDFESPLHFTPHRNTEGEAFFKEACEKGWEGIIAKRAASRYRHSRSRDWLKFKCEHGQELVIAGFTEPQGQRKGFGALLVGYYEDGELRYAGKVGTGYDDAFLEEFRRRMEARSTDTSPFVDGPDDETVTWVEPAFVGEFGFTEWTDDGKLRHPRFLGLRRDKKPVEVTREASDD